MADRIYERPAIVRNTFGAMNKVGRRGDLSNHAEIDGVSIDALCKEFGSPLFVFSERRLRARVREAREAFARRYPSTTMCWSYKTNYLDAICAVMHQEGSIAEVVSGMEYDKARRLGMPGDKIVFNGPAKTETELRRAVAERAIIHADHLEEIYLLEKIAAETGATPTVGVRVSLDAGIYPRWDRFGLGLENGQAMQAVKRIARGGKLALGGLHTHIGTFVLEPAAYGRAAAKLADFATEIEKSMGVRPTHVDLGGGFASTNTLATQYHAGAIAPGIGDYAEAITSALIAGASGTGTLPRLFIETGRALIDEAGTLLTSVVATKRLSTGKRAIVIDAGVNLLFTAWWYRLNIAPARSAEAFVEDTAVYGPLCMNIDCIRESVPLPDLRPGERLAIHPVGAYTVTQSMQFINLRPAVVMINEQGTPELIRRAEVLEDLTGPEVLPERLKLGATTSGATPALKIAREG
ncbi:MAG: alanine racemase [Deltaproteobacteria bacterium]|nr:alanine racemase [Deltaproteobacteria bacterium]